MRRIEKPAARNDEKTNNTPGTILEKSNTLIVAKEQKYSIQISLSKEWPRKVNGKSHLEKSKRPWHLISINIVIS
jgi:hypothetical protein